MWIELYGSGEGPAERSFESGNVSSDAINAEKFLYHLQEYYRFSLSSLFLLLSVY
jgi:hypothetical protein